MSTTCTFDLWKSVGTHDVFVMVVNFQFNNQEPKHVTINSFEAITTNSVTMVPKLWEIFDMFSLANKILAYVKDKGANL